MAGSKQGVDGDSELPLPNHVAKSKSLNVRTSGQKLRFDLDYEYPEQNSKVMTSWGFKPNTMLWTRPKRDWTEGIPANEYLLFAQEERPAEKRLKEILALSGEEHSRFLKHDRYTDHIPRSDYLRSATSWSATS